MLIYWRVLCLDLFVTAFRIQEGQGEQRGARMRIQEGSLGSDGVASG